MHTLEKKFPSYFNNFIIPEGAKEQSIKVYRACRTSCVDTESFLPSFEENNFEYLHMQDSKEPSVYSLSSYEKPNDVRRFAITNDSCNPPFKIAQGYTKPCCGLSQRTKERNPKYKGSHVDWWIYEGSKPNEHFELIENFEEFYIKYKIERSL